MSFTVLIKDVFSSLWRGMELATTKLEEFNKEQESIEPFRVIKRQAQEMKHVAQIASMIIPKSYTKSNEIMICITDIADIVINFMNATIDHPEQRGMTLIFLNNVQRHNNFKEAQNDSIKAKKNLTLLNDIMYKNGYYNASLSDKIRLVLSDETEEEIEKAATELLPIINGALQNIRSARTNLQKKGMITY